MELTAVAYNSGRPVCLRVEKGRIASARSIERPVDGLPWVAPGLVDVQVNGYGGQEFSSRELTAEKVAQIVHRHESFGVTALCPTVTTDSFDVMAHGVGAIAEAAASADLERQICGIHVEGPYFSKEDGPRGAHPLEHCRPPDWDEFQRLQQAANGRIRVLTMSPEFDGAPDFIARVVASGVVVALAHMSATGEQIRAAVDAGAALSTHLGNGAHRTLRRHPNYIWDQLAEDRLMASLIVDGHHLPAEVVKTFVRAKGPQRCILVSDVAGQAGLPPGRYDDRAVAIDILTDGRLVIAGQDQLLAGASRPLGVGVAGVIRFAGVDLAEAVAMASSRPAALVGYQPGGLSPGDPADLVLFDLAPPCGDNLAEQFQVRATLCGGRVVYGRVES